MHLFVQVRHVCHAMQTPEFLARFPTGKVPAMDTPNGPLFESFAIARYVARLSDSNPNIYPKDAYLASLVCTVFIAWLLY